LFSCGGGGGSGNSSSIAQPNPLTFSVSSLPSSVESYDLTSLQVISSIDECKFQIDSEDFLWISSSDGKNFNFRAPIIYVNSKDFTFNVSAISNTSKPECTGSKTLMLNVTRNQTQFIPDPDPSNIPYLSTPFFTAHDIGFGGIEITDRYSATVCYPTENDCVTYRMNCLAKMLIILQLVILMVMVLRILWLLGLFFRTQSIKVKKFMDQSTYI